MQDRNLYSKRRNRRKKRIKSRKKKKLLKNILMWVFILTLLYIFLRVSIFMLSGYINSNKSKSEDKKIEQNIGDTEQENKEVDKVIGKEDKQKFNTGDVYSTFEISKEKKYKDLENRLNHLIKNNKFMSSKKHVLAYYNLNLNESYIFNPSGEYALGNGDNFILAMYLYDMQRQGKIDLETSYSGKVKYDGLLNKDRVQGENSLKYIFDDARKYNISYMIENSLKNNDKIARQALIDVIEKESNKKWYIALNEKYGINISENNKLRVGDILKALKLMYSKKDDKFVYKEILDILQKDGAIEVEGSEISIYKVYGGLTSYSYPNFINIGYVEGKTSYVFAIISGGDDNTFNTPALKILDDWVNYYQKP